MTAKGGTGSFFEGFARFGYAAKGVVYVVIGALATMAALRLGGATTGMGGALETIVGQPYGKILLAVVAVGLVGYVTWRFLQAFLDVDRKGSDVKGLSVRAFYTASGLIYASLALGAVKLVLGSGGGGGGEAQADWTAKLMSQPFGRWLVAAAGGAVIGVGIYQAYQAITAKFRKRLESSEMSDLQDAWATLIGRIGFAARAVVFGMIGGFLIQAALKTNPQEARGLAGALRSLEEQPFGPWLLGAVGAGLAAFGLFQFVMARYRRITVE